MKLVQGADKALVLAEHVKRQAALGYPRWLGENTGAGPFAEEKGVWVTELSEAIQSADGRNFACVAYEDAPQCRDMAPLPGLFILERDDAWKGSKPISATAVDEKPVIDDKEVEP